jgi:hypothetical protein
MVEHLLEGLILGRMDVRWVIDVHWITNGSGRLKPIPILTTRFTSLAELAITSYRVLRLPHGRRAHAFVFIGGHGRHDRP